LYAIHKRTNKLPLLYYRLRDEHTLRSKVESECESMKGQAAAYKEKLQEATAGQAQAARLAAELDVEQTLHKEAKSHLATLESRYTLLTLLRQQLAVAVHLVVRPMPFEQTISCKVAIQQAICAWLSKHAACLMQQALCNM